MWKSHMALRRALIVLDNAVVEIEAPGSIAHNNNEGEADNGGEAAFRD
jgi:hypothetical protein